MPRLVILIFLPTLDGKYSCVNIISANPLHPKSNFKILLCSTPDDFTRQRFYVWCKTVNTCALCPSFVSRSIVSGGIIVFLCFILYDVTGDRLKTVRARQREAAWRLKS